MKAYCLIGMNEEGWSMCLIWRNFLFRSCRVSQILRVKGVVVLLLLLLLYALVGWLIYLVVLKKRMLRTSTVIYTLFQIFSLSSSWLWRSCRNFVQSESRNWKNKARFFHCIVNFSLYVIILELLILNKVWL